MLVKGIVPTPVDSILWQDYRSTKTGMVVYYNTDPVSELPIREIPEQYPTEVLPDPNYETASFGVYGCKHAKLREVFAKKKYKYLFFMTRYSGTNVDLTEELMVTGFYRIKQVADVQKLHIRYLREYSCLNEDSCTALHADVVHFVSVQDAFMITPEVLTAWAVSSRVTRQSKIVLNEEKTLELVTYLESKKNIVDLYIQETERLEPGLDDDMEEEEVEEEVLFEDAEEEQHDASDAKQAEQKPE